ncbi:TetR/AcrR family transcriptional regulator [Mycolicibacterium vaccae]|uniref:TetR/AcrR family transcriptional regulator n=1 Tax=Mycolicibacterium vaccae TaxID=1810 RepID=UPI003D027471
MEAVSPALRTRHATETRREQQILDTVLDMLAESGYEGLRLDTLARRARVSKATLYGRWGGKKELVLDAIRYAVRPIDDVDTGDLRSDLIAIGRAVDHSKQRSAGFMLAIGHTATIDGDFAELVQENLGAPVIAATRKAIAAAVDRGELRPGATELRYIVDVLPSLALGRRVFGVRRPVDVEEIVDTIVLPALRNA